MKRRSFSMLPALSLGLFINCASADTVEADFPRSARNPDNAFMRMFPDLPSFAEQSDRARHAVQQLGAHDGILDAHDDLTDPVQSITNPAVFSPRNPDNPAMTAGVTFFGQFLDHDLTLDKKSELNKTASPRRTVNFRTAAFDLDSVYGDGPTGSPELYEVRSGRIKFIVQSIPGSEAVSRHGTTRIDVPRDEADKAIIGDSRNDENILISQIHVAMLSFHNAVTDHLAKQPAYQHASKERLFEEARRVVTWHYQWIILHEFLPMTIGQDRVDRIMKQGVKFYKPQQGSNHARTSDGHGAARIPIEFSAAAYRFGHSQIRPSYRLNFGPTGGSPFFAFLLDDNLDPNAADPSDLRGGRRAPRRFVDWQTFFDFGDSNARPNKRIDTKLSSPLMVLPGLKAPAPGLPSDGLQSLPARTLTRHVNFGLPSGQAIARKMNLPMLTPEQLADLAPYALDSQTTMDTSTPLFFYILREAEVFEDGLRLGPVGAGIVGEVFIGVLQADESSYLSVMPEWTPTLPSAKPDRFTMTDFLTFAGVVPAL